tara:strand:+ start:211 stop:588 length:378 start_codon:yes stop_codon:yes gene_type:complete
MKKRTAIFSLILLNFSYAFVSFLDNANAEEYICADFGGEERPTFKRKGNTFLEIITLNGETEQHTHRIMNETNDFLVLVQTFKYKDAMVTILDKNKKQYSANYLAWEDDKDPNVFQSFGSCFVIN